MKIVSLTTVLPVTALLSMQAIAQVNLPVIVELPDEEDFPFIWGDDISVDNRERPQFSISGHEVPFSCTLIGSFRPGSRMSDYYNLREFEQSLLQTINFIQDATYRLNDLYQSNQLDWAIMDCEIPETTETEEQTQERVDKALERALRDRERRRERDARDDD